jgi:DNA-binding PadR family transcriptional regulator
MSKQIKLFLPTPSKLTPIQLLIMIQIIEAPKYGYEILRDLRDGFMGSWSPKTGTLYPALQALVKKGFVTKSSKSEKTHYSLSKKGISTLDDISNYVAEYLLFNSRFIESTVASLPPDFTQKVFSKIHEYGTDEVLPEATILDAISRLPSNPLKKAFLEHRRIILMRKLKLVKKHLKDLEQ